MSMRSRCSITASWGSNRRIFLLIILEHRACAVSEYSMCLGGAISIPWLDSCTDNFSLIGGVETRFVYWIAPVFSLSA